MCELIPPTDATEKAADELSGRRWKSGDHQMTHE
jgi:hypothetical protein